MSFIIVHTLFCHRLIRGTLTRYHFQRLKGPWVKEVGSLRLVSTMNSVARGSDAISDHNDLLFSLDRMTRRIATLSTLELVKPSIDPGHSDVQMRNAFQSSTRHTDVTPEDLSERWGISILTAARTLKKTTQNVLRSAVLPLSRTCGQSMPHSCLPFKGCCPSWPSS